MPKVTIAEAEAFLRAAREEERKENLKREYEIVKKEYEGKAFATHTFTKLSRGASCNAVFIESIKADDKGCIYLDVRTITVNNYPSGNVISTFKNHQWLKDDNLLNSVRNYTVGLRYAISVELFMTLWDRAKEASKGFLSDIPKEIPMTTLSSIVDTDAERYFNEYAKRQNIELVDLSKYNKVYGSVSLGNIPGVHCKKYIEKDKLVSAFEFYKQKLYSQRYHNYQEKIGLIDEFLKEFK